MIRVAVADLNGSVVSRVDQPNKSRSGTALLRTAFTSVEHAITEAGLKPGDIVVSVVGTPGIPDPATGSVHRAPNLPGWERRGLLGELVEALSAGGSEVIVENDANLTVVGEHARGAAQGVDVVAYVTVGTGIGMGVLLNGNLFRGAHGAAGEVGFLPYGQSASDVQRGQFEEAAAAESVVALARERGLSARSLSDVFAAARSGDVRALEVVRVEAERLAFLVASVTAVIDPELVVLGGGVGSNADLLLAPLEAALRTMTPLAPRIVAGSLGDGAVLSGAVAMGLEAARELVFEVTL